jgi:uncharacterized protein YggU (UPF0235/DUF167 family)
MKIAVEVKLKSRKYGIKKVTETSYIVYTSKAPEKNQANEDIIKQLARYFDVSKSQVEIVLGKTLTSKIISIDCDVLKNDKIDLTKK